MVAPHTIKERMEIVGSDGVHVGTVDHMEGADEVKLTRNDEEAGESTSSNQAPRPRRVGRRIKKIGRPTFAATPPGMLPRRGQFLIN